MKKDLARTALPVCVALLATMTPSLSAQTVYGLDGGAMATGTTLAWEFTMPPGGDCGAPNPVVETWSPNVSVGGGCSFPPGAFPPTLPRGGMAIDRQRDIVYVTSGNTVQSYHAGNPNAGLLPGTPIDSYLPDTATSGVTQALTGVTVDVDGDNGGPLLWITDGKIIASVVPPPGPACTSTKFITITTGVTPPDIDPLASITGLAWDPRSGTLWASDDMGFIHNFDPFFGGIPTTIDPIQVGLPGGNPALCGLTDGLRGLDVDMTIPDPIFGLTDPTIVVTDGTVIARIAINDDVVDTASPAPPTFYAPVSCQTSPAPNPLSGLAFSGHGISYGNSLTPGLSLSSWGNTATPSESLGLRISSSAPLPDGTLVFMIFKVGSDVSPQYLCPPAAAPTWLLWVDPAGPGPFLGIGSWPSGQTFMDIPLAPLAAGIPTGAAGYVQFILDPPAGQGVRQATDAQMLMTSLP